MAVKLPSIPDASRLRNVPPETWVLLAGVLVWDLWVLRRLIIGFDHTDFAIFYDAGRAWLTGADLYRSHRGALVNLNPPISALLFAPFALLPERAAGLLWMLLNIAALAASFRLIVRELNVDRSLPTGLTGMIWLGLLGPTVHMLWVANLAWILMLPATLAWCHARRGRDTAAGVWLGLVLALKPIFLLFIPYWTLRRRWRSIASAVAVGIVSLLVGVAVFGISSYRSWIEAGRAVTWFGDSANVSLLGTLTRTVPTRWVMPLWYVAAGSAIVAVIARLRREDSVDSEWALLWIASILISPLGWLYYYALAAGPLIGAFYRRRTTTLAVAAVALCVPAPILVNLAPHEPAVVWFGSCLAGLSTLMVFDLLARGADANPLRRSATP